VKLTLRLCKDKVEKVELYLRDAESGPQSRFDRCGVETHFLPIVGIETELVT
jgi:hypothetical protein